MTSAKPSRDANQAPPAPARPWGPHGHVPVSMCSPRFHTVEVGGFLVSEVWFPPDTLIPDHTHARPVLGVMLRGGFDDRFARRTLTPEAGELFTEPGEERHANRVGHGGAHVLALQPDPCDDALMRGGRGLLDEIRSLRHAGIALFARSLVREMRGPDELSPLAIESLALDMLVTAARQEVGTPEPPWLRRVDEMVRDAFRQPLDMAGIAREAGVHRSHLARMYRRYRGLPIGVHMRRRRVEWAAEQLSETDGSLSSIALRAGFADQSHFTRAFKRRFGVPPGAYRSRLRGRAGP